MPSVKACFACGLPVKGRSDKKFCNDYCRNTYNNRVKERGNKYIRRVNNALAKNRRILGSLLQNSENGDSPVRASREKLMLSGFQFNYMTHTYTTRNGKTYYYCYDYGYLPLENDWYLIVKKREE